MSETMKELLWFLSTNSRMPDLAIGAADLAAPYFSTVEAPGSSWFGLAPPTRELRRELCSALHKAIGGARRVVAVSASELVPRPPATVDARISQLAAAVRDRISDKTWHSVGSRLYRRHNKRLWTAFGDGIGHRLSRVVQDSLGGNTLDRAIYSVRDLTGECFSDILFCFLGAVINADIELLGQLTPLVRLAHSAIPLGESNSWPGTWLALTA